MKRFRLALRALVPVALIATFVAVPTAARAAITYTVNSTADTTDGTCSGPGNTVATGDCTLREAILNANSNAGDDTIDFGLPGSAPYTITLTSQLPNVTGGVGIDGTTQPGYSGSPIVIVSGNHTVGDGFHLMDNGGSSIRGLSLVGFTDGAVFTNSGGHTIAGNYIGVMPDGTTANANGAGVFLFSSTVGGTGPDDRNVISGNVNSAVTISGGGSQVLGNYLGTDAAGTVAVPNQVGVTINGGGSNTIGGNDPSKGNVISGNSQNGITITGNSGAVAQSNVVQNNQIGVDATGSGPLGNGGAGVWLPNYASNTTVGEPNSGGGGFAAATGPDGNVIAYNSGAGVSIGGQGTAGNTISQNSIYSNSGLGIDLNSDGVTRNDDDIGGDPQTPDTDTGPNALQNWPELGNVQVNNSEGIQVVTSGDLYSTPNTGFTIDYYSASSCDASANGEGQFFEGSTIVTTDADGRADVATTLGATTGSELTATATNQSTGDTSEFSNCVHVPQEIEADLAVSKSDAAPNGPDPVTAGNNVGYDIDVSNQGPDNSTGVAVTDDLPPDASFVSATGTGWSCDFDSGTDTVFCQRNGLHVDQTASIIVVVKSPDTPPDGCPAAIELGSCITDSATVDFFGPDDQFDPNGDNNTATESTEVQPKPSNPDDSTGFVPPDGGTVTTGNNPNSTDTTDASVTLPSGPGGVVDIQEQTPPPNLCVNGCTGQAVEVNIPDGYTDPAQPPKVVLKYDVTVVRPKGGAKIYIKKGDAAPFLAPTCLQHGVANPSPCVGSRTRLPNGDLRVTVLLLSGDPLCGKH